MQKITTITRAAKCLLALGFYISSNSVFSAVCINANSDPDGDGIGFENGSQCSVVVNCASSLSDPDGDGWGWENDRSCVVTSNSAPQPTECIDDDGDGWGWDGQASCIVTAPIANDSPQTADPGGQSSAASTCIDTPPFNDNWGWNGHASCTLTAHSTTDVMAEQTADPAEASTTDCEDTPPLNDGWGWNGTSSCRTSVQQTSGISARELAQITDVVLVTGQSNTLGSNTAVDPVLDAPSGSVYAWTDRGWDVASLTQVWDLGWHPRTTPDGLHPHNNFALHFGKYVTANSDRKVAFILLSAPGRPISHWDTDKDFFRKIQHTVPDALRLLPHIDQLNAILWHQGENNWNGGEHYRHKLGALIGNFRAEPWYSDDSLFICGETYRAQVNADLNRLNSDGDIRTACVSADGLGVLGDEVHFNAAGLREIGRRYGAKYLAIQAGDQSSQ